MVACNPSSQRTFELLTARRSPSSSKISAQRFSFIWKGKSNSSHMQSFRLCWFNTVFLLFFVPFPYFMLLSPSLLHLYENNGKSRTFGRQEERLGKCWILITKLRYRESAHSTMHLKYYSNIQIKGNMLFKFCLVLVCVRQITDISIFWWPFTQKHLISR